MHVSKTCSVQCHSRFWVHNAFSEDMNVFQLLFWILVKRQVRTGDWFGRFFSRWPVRFQWQRKSMSNWRCVSFALLRTCQFVVGSVCIDQKKKHNCFQLIKRTHTTDKEQASGIIFNVSNVSLSTDKSPYDDYIQIKDIEILQVKHNDARYRLGTSSHYIPIRDVNKHFYYKVLSPFSHLLTIIIISLGLRWRYVPCKQK